MTSKTIWNKLFPFQSKPKKEKQAEEASQLYGNKNFERDLKLVYYTAFFAWFFTILPALLRYVPVNYHPVRFLMDQFSVIPFGLMMGIFIYRYFKGTKVALFGSLALFSMLMTYLLNIERIYDYIKMVTTSGTDYMQTVFVNIFLTSTTYFLTLTALQLALFLVKSKRESAEVIAKGARSEKRLEEAQRVANMGYWEWDIHSDQLHFSKEALALCRFKDDNKPVKVRDLLRKIIPKDRVVFSQYLDAVLAGEKPLEPEIQFDLPGEVLIDFHLLAYLSYDNSGIPDRLVGTIQNVTRRKEMERERIQLEEQLLQARKIESLGVLSGGVAHDFNNLLVGILSRASLAQTGLDPGSETYGHLNNITLAAERAAGLCDQMLAFSGKGTFESEPLDLNELLQEVEQLLKHTLNENAELEIHLPETIPLFDADSSQICQLAMNLVMNASDSFEEMSGKIKIQSGVIHITEKELNQACFTENLKPGKCIYFEVSDSGCGINEEMINKIFDPFYSTKFTGRGLGLAASIGIVRGHGGAIIVESQEGVGSTFRILFPVSKQALLPKTKVNIPTITGEVDGTILIADDEDVVRNVTKQVLVKAGYQVEMVEDGQKAIDICKDDPSRFVAIILDKTMPGLNGEQTLKELRKLRVDSPVLLTSGYDIDSSKESYETQGFACFVKKPYRPKFLLNKLDQSIQNSKKNGK
jgi:signal transduction histidine kinase